MSAPAVLPGPFLKRSLKSSIHGDQSGTDEPSGKENITSDERTACVLNG